MSLRSRTAQTCPKHTPLKYSRHFWRVGDILTKHFFLIHTGWVCIHGNFQKPLRFTTMSWNYRYCLISFCLFLSLPLSQGSLEKEKDLRTMEWTERGQFNICFYLIGNRERFSDGVETQRRQKRSLEWNNIWTFLRTVNMQPTWTADSDKAYHIWWKIVQNRKTNCMAFWILSIMHNVCVLSGYMRREGACLLYFNFLCYVLLLLKPTDQQSSKKQHLD